MSNLLSASDALVALLDGADHDDVVRMTGLPMVTVEAIFSARDRALTEKRANMNGPNTVPISLPQWKAAYRAKFHGDYAPVEADARVALTRFFATIAGGNDSWGYGTICVYMGRRTAANLIRDTLVALGWDANLRPGIAINIVYVTRPDTSVEEESGPEQKPAE